MQRAPDVYVLPSTLGATVRATADELKHSEAKAHPSALLYAEKAGGFQCRTCWYAQPTNATHGKCEVIQGTIHLDNGCCVAWDANLDQLQLYREPREP